MTGTQGAATQDTVPEQVGHGARVSSLTANQCSWGCMWVSA